MRSFLSMKVYVLTNILVINYLQFNHLYSDKTTNYLRHLDSIKSED